MLLHSTILLLSYGWGVVGGRVGGDLCQERQLFNQEFKNKLWTKVAEIKKIVELEHHNSSRVKRDYGHHEESVVVRCKSSYTGLFSFLAIPLLMGDIMIDFMNMIDIAVNIEITTAATEATTTTAANNNNNNNNNNGGEGGGEEGGEGEGGNNNNNNNPRSLYPDNILSFDIVKQFINQGEKKSKRSARSENFENQANLTEHRAQSFVRSYMNKTDTIPPQSRGLPVSGDWTDYLGGAQVAAGPFSGVMGWGEQKHFGGSRHQLQQVVLSKRFVYLFINTYTNSFFLG